MIGKLVERIWSKGENRINYTFLSRHNTITTQQQKKSNQIPDFILKHKPSRFLQVKTSPFPFPLPFPTPAPSFTHTFNIHPRWSAAASVFGEIIVHWVHRIKCDDLELVMTKSGRRQKWTVGGMTTGRNSKMASAGMVCRHSPVVPHSLRPLMCQPIEWSCSWSCPATKPRINTHPNTYFTISL